MFHYQYSFHDIKDAFVPVKCHDYYSFRIAFNLICEVNIAELVFLTEVTNALLILHGEL